MRCLFGSLHELNFIDIVAGIIEIIESILWVNLVSGIFKENKN